MELLRSAFPALPPSAALDAALLRLWLPKGGICSKTVSLAALNSSQKRSKPKINEENWAILTC
jgi:hypothetical protein